MFRVKNILLALALTLIASPSHGEVIECTTSYKDPWTGRNTTEKYKIILPNRRTDLIWGVFDNDKMIPNSRIKLGQGYIENNLSRGAGLIPFYIQQYHDEYSDLIGYYIDSVVHGIHYFPVDKTFTDFDINTLTIKRGKCD
ncbi:hypothetical protein V5T82_07225 [Magnetovibrio sp. PR-2]|uniref:hypothetical protein n=1 Tax=Magnetovibrio sp. PR-2 TaxID=3120356 RepID=UPI002FCE0976